VVSAGKENPIHQFALRRGSKTAICEPLIKGLLRRRDHGFDAL